MIPQRYSRLLLVLAATLTLPVTLGAVPRNSDRAGQSPARVAAAVARPAPTAAAPASLPVAYGRSNTSLVRRAPEHVESRPAPSRPSLQGVATGGSLIGRAGLEPQAVRPLVSAPTILYAPSEADDPAYRAAIAAITGGAVDYFDASAGTPTAVQLAAYTCVYTWANFPYADRVLFGDRLADYVDAGGKVVLGSFCTYTVGNSMGGRIMTPAYSPVTAPAGLNHFASSPYAGDGTKSLHAGVLAYTCDWRDILVTQGAGIVNGTYADGEIAHAYRPDGRVIYSNGGGATQISGTSGDWPKLIANAAIAHPASPGLLLAPSEADDPSFRLSVGSFTTGIVDYFNSTGGTPSAALLNTYDCVATWVDFEPADPVLLGDRLADRVDTGGRVILGPFCTFTSSPFNLHIGGRIMTPDYCPVTSPFGTNHYSTDTQAGDGVTGLFTGVTTLSTQYRDYLVGQGNGIVDGHYSDGEILASYRPDGRVIHLSGTAFSFFGVGDWARLWANAVTTTFPAGHRMLYAPSNGDDATYRAQIAAQTGGTVDYFNAITGTPSAALLSTYDCVYTWANSAYSDKVLFGNRLADYADAGGKVILGVYCTYTTGNFLAGRIMTPAYCPVISPLGDNHGSLDTYVGDGTTCFHRNIGSYSCYDRDILVTQGSGIVDGHFGDGEIALAYRPDRRVVYVNGLGSSGGFGDWGRLFANACDCRITNGVLYGCNDAAQMFVINPVTAAGSLAYNLPTAGSIGATEIECAGTSGDAWVQGRDFTDKVQTFNIGTGLPLSGQVADGTSFNGMEYALGRLYATAVSGGCNPSDFRVLNPTTGASTTLGPTGMGPISGLAFDARANALYGITSCGGPSLLVRIDVTSGAAATVGPTPTTFSSLEFGPDGDLYAGGDFFDGGHFCRISTTTGWTVDLGLPGYGPITGLTLAPPGTVDAPQGPAPKLAFATPFPNPSQQGMVQFRFSVPTAGNARLELYDVAGRLRWQKAMPGLEPGAHTASWDGRASSGERLGSGVYQMRLISPAGQRAVRIVRLD